MKRFTPLRPLLLALSALIAILLIAEFFVRSLRPDLNTERLYRKAHCFDGSLLLLCPSTTGQYLRPDGSHWTMTADDRAERLVPDSQPDRPEIWWIGDSISMGYLLDDDQTVPYLFSKKGYNVRNLGSDSLGTRGIAHRLNKALVQSSARPAHLFWIYNTSDFPDDLKDLRTESSLLYRLAFRLHYELSRRSALYLLIRSRPADMNQLPPGFDVAPSDDHPTFKNLLAFADKIQSGGLSLTIIVYPGMDPRTEGPGLEDPTTDKLVTFLSMHRREKDGRSVFDVIDLRGDFQQMAQSGNSPYIKGDGHPNALSARLFADTAERYLKGRPQN